MGPLLSPPMIELAAWTPRYKATVRQIASALNSDGCSGVPDFYIAPCLEHDIHFRTHQTVGGRSITFEEAKHWVGERIKAESGLGRLSPMAWWRERGVALFGRRAWEHDDQGSAFCAVYRASHIRRWGYRGCSDS